MKNIYRFRPLPYYSLTFALTSALWLAGAYFSFQSGQEGLYTAFMLAGLLAPFVVSLAFIYSSGNSVLKKNFVERLTNIKLINPRTLPVIVLLMPLSVLVSIAISLPFGGSVEQFQLADGFSFSTGVVPVLAVLVLAAGLEELGWRGYAFDSLQSRYNFLTASIVFSLLWSLWHFPLIFVKDSYQYEILQQNAWFAVNFFVSIIPMGIIISWVCLKNNKSVVAAAFFHFLVNISLEAFAVTQTTKSIVTGVLTLVVIGIIVIDRATFFPKDSTSMNAVDPASSRGSTYYAS